MVKQTSGFTLVELMITVALIGLLATIAAPYTVQWFQDAQVRQAANLLESAYGRARATAQRNPEGATESDPAAVLKLTNSAVLVCSGAAASCNAGSSHLLWQAAITDGVTLTVNGSATGSFELLNTGHPSANPSLSYSANKGSVTYEGTLQ